MSEGEQIAHLLIFFEKKNKRFAQKTDEQIPNPAVNDRRRINTEDKAKVFVVCLVDGIDSISSPKKQRRPMLSFLYYTFFYGLQEI